MADRHLAHSMTTKQIPWARFGFESVLIISSILIALAVDSWREHRIERDDERQALASLLNEFEQNKVELDRALNTLTVSQSGASQLMALAGKTLTDLDKEIIDQSLTELFSYYTFDPSSGALDSLLSAGQLDLILNMELRSRLAGWSGLIRDYKEEEREVDYVVYRELIQYLRPIAPFPNVEDISPGVFGEQWQDAFADVEFLNLLGQASFSIESTVFEAGEIAAEIDQIIDLISSELNE